MPRSSLFPPALLLTLVALSADTHATDAGGASQPLTQPGYYCGTADPGMAPAGGVKTLSELVDIGMKQNSDTRVAWLQAEDAALELGIARSKYGPIIAAQAVALQNHAALPLPKTLNPNGYFKTDAAALVPALTLKWLLYDGGGKDAVLDGAGLRLAAADFGFSTAHRRVTILITQQFFHLAAQVARLTAARATLQSTQTVEQLALARQRRGLGTAPEALQAHAQVAQAELRLEEADAAAQDARMAVLEAAGLRPDTPSCIAIPAMARRVTAGQQSIDQLIAHAIATRPEVGAALAQVQVSDAAVRQARSEYGPRLALAAHAGQNLGRMRSDGGPWSNVNQPIYGIGLTFDIPIYDGQIRSNEVAVARSKVEASTARLDGVRNKVIHEVVKASHDLSVAVRRRESSAALLAAAGVSFDATLSAYRRGLATMPELQAATAALASARTGDSEAGADLLIARAVLSFAGGDLIELAP
jgi:outer membrane protein